VFRHDSASQPQDAHFVLVTTIFVVADMQEALGAWCDCADMAEQVEDLGRGAVVGEASQVDERLSVHPSKIEEVGAGNLLDAVAEALDDLP
jgi:hypothetical protein